MVLCIFLFKRRFVAGLAECGDKEIDLRCCLCRWGRNAARRRELYVESSRKGEDSKKEQNN